ncbi:MAG: hypothetical protein IJB97_04960, partial [Clostridia bacterium]|nr:hypothetical protein [Clostridia bacterium]
MNELLGSVSEFDLRMDEIKLALKKCREQEYAVEPVREAANLIVDYIEWTTDTELQEALLAMLARLKERRAEAKRLEDEQNEKLGGLPAGHLAAVIQLFQKLVGFFTN